MNKKFKFISLYLPLFTAKGKKEKYLSIAFSTDELPLYDKLKSLPNAESYLKEGVSFSKMDKKAFAITDNQSADRLQKARRLLFKTIDERRVNQA